MKSDKFRVLVPLDGSTFAERALEAVLPLVKARDGEIDLLSVVLREAVEIPPDLEGYHKRLRDRLEWEGVRAEYRIRLGDPATEILEVARERGADLIAMTSHGRSGLRRILMGSVTEEVLRESEIPLLVTTPEAKVEHGPRILVPLDGSERAEEALADAARLVLEDPS